MKDVVHFYTHQANVFSMEYYDQMTQRTNTTTMMMKVVEYSNDWTFQNRLVELEFQTYLVDALPEEKKKMECNFN